MNGRLVSTKETKGLRLLLFTQIVQNVRYRYIEQWVARRPSDVSNTWVDRNPPVTDCRMEVSDSVPVRIFARTGGPLGCTHPSRE